jgi:hypothetical protein
MGDIGAVAGAVTVAGQIALEVLKPDLRKLVASEQDAARRDCRRFAEALLNRDAARCDFMLDGLRAGTGVDLAAGERDQLQLGRITVSAHVLLGLYCRGRAADLAASVADIVQLTGGEK